MKEENMKVRENIYKKLQKEYSDFIENLKKQQPEKIIDRAYEITIKEEIVAGFYPKCEKYSIDGIKALNKIKYPLEELYQDWMHSEDGIHFALENSVYYTLDELINRQKDREYER